MSYIHALNVFCNDHLLFIFKRYYLAFLLSHSVVVHLLKYIIFGVNNYSHGKMTILKIIVTTLIVTIHKSIVAILVCIYNCFVSFSNMKIELFCLVSCKKGNNFLPLCAFLKNQLADMNSIYVQERKNFI